MSAIFSPTNQTTASEWVYCSYYLTDFLGEEVGDFAEFGVSVVVHPHTNPAKVWLVCFDSARHALYRMLGLVVGEEQNCTLQVRYSNEVSQVLVSVFECERLTTFHSDTAMDHIHQLEDTMEYLNWPAPSEVLLPQPHKALQDLIYAVLTLKQCGYYFGAWDWKGENILSRPDGTLFLADVLFCEGSAAPDDCHVLGAELAQLRALVKR